MSDVFDVIFSKPQIILIVGRPESGKSYLSKMILDQGARKGYFNFGLIFSLTPDYPAIPEKYVVEGHNDTVLQRYILQLDKWKKANKTKKNPKPVPPANFLLWDDVLGSLKDSSVFQTFLPRFRHYGTTIILSTQSLSGKDIPTHFKKFMNFGFIFPVRDMGSLRAVYNLCGFLNCKNEKEFGKFLESMTKEEFQCMIYSASGKNLEEVYDSYQAPKNYKFLKLIKY